MPSLAQLRALAAARRGEAPQSAQLALVPNDDKDELLSSFRRPVAVQEYLRRTGRDGAGMVTQGPRLLDGRDAVAGGDWEVVTGQDDDGRWWWRVDGQDRTIDEGEADTEDEAQAAAEAAMERDRG